MTKRERLSFALRRLRTVKAQGDIAHRIRATHEIIKQVIDELSSGTQNADLGQHTTQLLDELYVLNTGAIEARRLLAPPVMPDCAEQIQLHTDALAHLDSIDNAQHLLEAVINTLCHTLSVFAQGPNEQPVQTLLDRVQQAVEQAHALTPPWPDIAPLLQPHIDALETLVLSDDPEAMGNAGTTILCRALSAFAQGPNEEPIQMLLAAVDRLNQQQESCMRLPADTDPFQLHIAALTALEDVDDPDALTAAAAIILYQALAEMAQGPHEASIRALLDTFDRVTGTDERSS